MLPASSRKIIFLVIPSVIVGIIIGVIASSYIDRKVQVSNAVLLNIRATMLYDGGDIDQALGVLYQAVALNPTDYSPYALMGKIYASQKKYELALKSYELALDNAENAKPSELRSERVIMRDMSMIRAKLAELRKN